MAAPTLLEALDKWAGKCPDKTAFTFLDDAGEEAAFITFAGLQTRSQALAALLTHELPLKRGDRVLLVYPPCLDFIVAFLACLRAGVVAVPVFPPDPRRLRNDLHMFQAVQRSCGAKIALTSAEYNYAKKMSDIKAVFGANGGKSWPELRWVVTDKAAAAAAAAGGAGGPLPPLPAPPAAAEVAFLQYTSGSTSEPKGVMVTHGNLAHNLSLITAGLAAGEDTVVVSWLPQYHDMGLVGSYLGCLFCGGRGYYISPATFVRRPTLWLELASRCGATHLQAPSFAYALATRKYLAADPQPQLDLSSVRHAINAAEPVDPVAVDRFQATFEPCGLRRGVVFPTYGLAEHTVYVCSNGAARLVVDRADLEAKGVARPVDKLMLWAYGLPGAGDLGGGDEGVKTAVMVGCGKPADSAGLDVRIVDDKTRCALPEGKVGEIWLDSPSKASGYWGLSERSQEDFHARLAAPGNGGGSGSGGGGSSGEAGAVSAVSGPETAPGAADGYLRTGDLGFLWQGELYICGRLKDMVIIRGRNHFPQDIEKTAEAVAPENGGGSSSGSGGYLRPGSAAAFTMALRPGGPEVLILVAEVNDAMAAAGEASAAAAAAAAAATAIRAAVTAAHGVALAGITLLRPRTVPKTTSGKIARQWCRRGYEAGTLEAVYSWRDPTSADAEEEESGAAAKMPTAAAAAGKENGAAADGGGPVDVGGLSEEQILALVAGEMARVLKLPAAEIPTDVPLAELGLDSMEGIQLLALLEQRFAVKLPEEIMGEPDTILAALVPVIQAGGTVRERPMVVDCCRLAALERSDGPPKPFDAADSVMRRRLARLSRSAKKASFTTGRFRSGELSAITPMPAVTAAVTMVGLAVVVALAALPMLFLLFVSTKWDSRPASIVALALGVLPMALQRLLARHPAAGRYSATRQRLLDFFSFKWVFDGGKAPPPGTYVFYGVDVGVVAQLCTASAAPSAAGIGIRPTHGGFLKTSPLFRALFSLLGGTTEPGPALLRGESVMVLGDESKKAAAQAAELAVANNAMLVPCCTFAGAVGGYGRWPVTLVTGKPLRTPAVSESDSEDFKQVVSAAAAKLEEEILRLADTYAEAFAAGSGGGGGKKGLPAAA